MSEVKSVDKLPAAENVSTKRDNPNTLLSVKDQIEAGKEYIKKNMNAEFGDPDEEDYELDVTATVPEKPILETDSDEEEEEDGEDSDATQPDRKKPDDVKEEKPVSASECPECQSRKRKKTGGFPFGRDPAAASAQPKKPKEDPKTHWGKFQRHYADKFKDLNSTQVSTAIARVYYVPVHSKDGTATQKSLERLIRETHEFIQPWAKSIPDDENGEKKAKARREWTQELLRDAIVNHHISTHGKPKDDKSVVEK